MTPVHPRLPAGLAGLAALAVQVPLPLLAAGLLACGPLAGCASRPAPSGAPGPLDFHRSLQMDEYLQQSTQDSVRVPEKADALLLVHPFATNQPAGQARTLAQIFVRIRSAGPDLPPAPDGTPYLSARMFIKVSPGFRMVRLYGVSAVDSVADGYQVAWDTLSLGEWRVVVAEVEGYLPPSASKERLIGATLRTTRLTDGGVFETIEGTGMEWHQAGSPAKLNPWTARNSLYLADGEALKEAGRLAEQGEAGRALALLDLQLLTIQALKDLDPQGIADEERRLSGVRAALAAKVQNPAAAPASAPADGSKEALKPRVAAAREQASQAPQGVWSTLAGLLEVRE